MRFRALVLIPLLAGGLAAQYGTKPKPSEQDYPVHTKLDKISIGAEYMIHTFSDGRDIFIAKDFLVVEVAIFPAAGENLVVSADDFKLRVNGRKQALVPRAAEFVAASLKDQSWDNNHPHTAVGVGPVVFGAPQPTERFPGDRSTPPSSRVPPRAPDDNPSGADKQPPVTAEELVVRTALPEGEHHGPVSGYLYFPYSGSIKRIHALQLDFTGSLGSASLPLI